MAADPEEASAGGGRKVLRIEGIPAVNERWQLALRGLLLDQAAQQQGAAAAAYAADEFGQVPLWDAGLVEGWNAGWVVLRVGRARAVGGRKTLLQELAEFDDFRGISHSGRISLAG